MDRIAQRKMLVLANGNKFKIYNVCSAEKLTKRSTVLLLCLVSFSAEEMLDNSIMALQTLYLLILWFIRYDASSIASLCVNCVRLDLVHSYSFLFYLKMSKLSVLSISKDALGLVHYLRLWEPFVDGPKCLFGWMEKSGAKFKFTIKCLLLILGGVCEYLLV